MEDLLEMLRYRRPHKSRTEGKFINRFLRPLGVETDEVGNLYKVVGDAPSILWSAHTDSVHRSEGKQNLLVDVNQQSVRLSFTERQSNCLGADNAAGVWLLTQMIAAGVPGLYVFHRGEECGGYGSRFFADNSKWLLDTIEAAIAFDRRKTHSIITHQWGGRCCSEAFAQSLSAILGLGHKSDSGGTFTDTANYTHIVRECTNISVGFDREHTQFESLDLGYLARLRDAVIHADWSKLTIERDPAQEPDWELEIVDDYGYTPGRKIVPFQRTRHSRDLLHTVKDYPDLVADFLEHQGLEDELSEYIDRVEFGSWDEYVDKQYSQ